MADRYATEYVGTGRDGTGTARIDGAIIAAPGRHMRATKDNVNALAAADRLYLGKLPIGAVVRNMMGCTDTSWGTTTFSIGTTASPAKYVAAGTALTAVNTPTNLPLKASAVVAAPLTAEEDLWLTIATTTLAAATVAAINVEYTTSA